jgi:hypothetical protein
LLYFSCHQQGRGIDTAVDELSMTGLKLLKDITAATGLPSEGVENELDRLIHAAGIKKENLTLDDLREVLANYMQDILLSAQQEFSDEN